MMTLLLALLRPAPAQDLHELALQAQSQGDCGEAALLWWELIEQEGDDLEAYKGIAACSREGGIDHFVADTTSAFEESQVLGLVPVLLDELQLRELIPILNQVETQADKGVEDYLILTRLYRRLDHPAKALDALRAALSLDPDNAQLHLEYGNVMVEQGRLPEARAAFKGAVRRPGAASLAGLYGAMVAWWWAFELGVLGVLGLTAVVFLHRGDPAREGSARHTLVAVSALTTLVLLASFALAATKGAFIALSLATIFAGAWLLLSPFRGIVSKAASGLLSLLSRLLPGRLDRALADLSVGGQLGLLVGGVFVVTVLVPLVPQTDLRLGLLALTGLLFFSTLGTLILGLLRSSPSLQSSLRWLAVSGTLPFLLFFLYGEQTSVRWALESGSWLSEGTTRRLAGYLLVWAGGTALTLLLARIISKSILEPLALVDQAVERIRKGDFSARTGVTRRDELGLLAGAVDEMAEGLAHRERIKDTFRQFVDPAVAERLMAEDPAMATGQRLHAAVLFSDVRGFTTLSERTDAEVVVRVLNESMEALAPVVARWGGVLDKFMGDAIMAVWGVPEPIRTGPLAGVPSERLAVQAAIEMHEAMEAVNRSLASRGLPTLQLGVGIHSGELIAGPVGSAARREYTVIGDTVNTAQRTESMARGENRLLVTEAVAAVVRPFATLVAVEPVVLKGKAELVQLYRVEALVERLVAGPSVR